MAENNSRRKNYKYKTKTFFNRTNIKKEKKKNHSQTLQCLFRFVGRVFIYFNGNLEIDGCQSKL